MWRSLRLVWRAAPGAATASVALVALQATLPLAGLYLFKLLVDAVVAGVAGNAGAAADTTGGDFSRVQALVVVAAGVAVVAVIVNAVAAYVAESLSMTVTDTMLDTLAEQSARVDFAYYEDPQYYNSLHRAQQEAPYRPAQLLFNLTQVVQSTIVAGGILILLASVHALLALTVVVAVLPALLLRIRHSRRLHRWQVEWASDERHATYLGWLVGSAEHAKEVRIFGLGDLLRTRLRALRDRLRASRLTLARARSAADAGAQAGATLVVFGSYGFIAYQTLQGTLTLGDLAMYFGAVQRGQASMQALFGGVAQLYEDNLFLSHADEFLALSPTMGPPGTPRAVPRPLKEGVTCAGVAFRYPGSPTLTLDDINLRAEPGEIVALVGANGSGKSTLVKLLCRLYDPHAGAVRIDGIDLREFDPAELRRHVAVVFQDFARYHLAARENIWFGDTRVSPASDRVVAAATVAGVDRALRNLTHGYETVLGRLFPEGEELSAGEWQKVALARAFMRDAPVLIVDEPTSALDPAAEADVFRSLSAQAPGRATIVISHRLSTVELAHRVYCMQAGRIVESGSSSELLRRGGVFAQLFGGQSDSRPAPASAGA